MLRVIFIFCLLVSSVSFAADEDVEVIPRPGTSQNKQTVIDDSSEFHRMGKSYLLNAQLLGIGPNLISSQGLTAGYFLNRNMIIMIEGLYGKSGEGYTFFGGDTGDYNIKGTSFGVHLKHFVANSFYYRAGVDYRTVNYDYSYTSLFSPSNNVSRSFKGKSVGVTFAIGNQWQFKNFTLGCDWVGITVPISKSVSGEAVNSSTPTYDQSRLEEDEKNYVKDTTLNLLRFYIGAAF